MSDHRFVPVPQFVARHGRMILRDALVAAIVLYALSYLIPNTYTATALMLPPSSSDEMPGGFTGGGGTAILSRAFGLGGETQTDLHVGILRSSTVAGWIIERFGLAKVYKEKDPENVARELTRNTKIGLTNERFIAVSVTDRDPKRAADMANAYVENLDRFLTYNTNRSARLRRQFLGERLGEARDSLARAENALRDYQVRHHMPITGEVGSMAEGVGEMVAEKLRRELELGTLRSVGAVRSPRVAQLEAELAQLDREIGRIPPAATDIIRLARDAKVQEKIVLVLVEEHERARLMELKNVAVVEVLDSAAPPLRKSGPKRTMIAAGAFLLAAVSSYLLRALRDRNAAGA